MVPVEWTHIPILGAPLPSLDPSHGTTIIPSPHSPCQGSTVYQHRTGSLALGSGRVGFVTCLGAGQYLGTQEPDQGQKEAALGAQGPRQLIQLPAPDLFPKFGVTYSSQSQALPCLGDCLKSI